MYTSNISKVNRNTAANEIKDIPKCSANTKSDCPHTTAAAPIKPCRIRKKKERKLRNLTSRMLTINIQAKTKKSKTVTSITEETSRWLNSIINSGVILLGISSPSHKGQLFPQPAPESVLVTKAPPRRMNIIPMVETTASHLTVLNISLASLLFLKLC